MRGLLFTLIALAVGCSSSSDDGAPVVVVADAGIQPRSLAGTACSCDSECPASGEHAGACVYGVCMPQASAPCSSPGSADECPTGSRCWSFASANLCFPDCGDGSACAGTCDRDGSCVPDGKSNCDASCSTTCRREDAPCGPKATEGRCPSGAVCDNGTCISKGCPTWRCSDADCHDIVPMPGPTDPKSPEAEASGYYVSKNPQYSYLRKDLTRIIAYAACEVRYRFPGSGPIGLSDLTQADGKTPGTDVGNPRHETSTHRGSDIDIAYFQTDGENNPQIICGDGSDTNPNGMRGKFNDGYFCTTSENIVDWTREVWLLAKFAESPKARVFGIDRSLPDEFRAGTIKLRAAGDVNAEVAERMTHLGVGAQGGWQFHHHHSHMSYFP